jgi:hypothetical protein
VRFSSKYRGRVQVRGGRKRLTEGRTRVRRGHVRPLEEGAHGYGAWHTQLNGGCIRQEEGAHG